MSEQSAQRKASTTKNIKKLRTISMVCGLTRNWQQWVTDNEDKQAGKPSGWSPSWLGGPAEEPIKPWRSKPAPTVTALPKPSPPTAASQDEAMEPGKPQKPSNPLQKAAVASGMGADVETSAVPMVNSCIKTKAVVKTGANSIVVKDATVGPLSRWAAREVLPSGDEIDRLLNKRSSPTRRRKCANMVSSLTKSWKEVEKEHKPVPEGVVREGKSCVVNKEDNGYSGAGEKVLDQDGEQTVRTGSSKETEKDLPEGDAVSAIKIKQTPVPAYKNEAEDAKKINALSKKYSAVCNLKSRWQNWASEHTVNQKLNPFSEEFDYEYSMSLRLHKGEEGYGRPKEGTKTAERAKRAKQHIHREIDDMCYVIRTMADPDPDGVMRVTFVQLFDRYVRISDKVVGILMRARKHSKVAFEGEMLWQGRDDDVIITLLV